MKARRISILILATAFITMMFCGCGGKLAEDVGAEQKKEKKERAPITEIVNEDGKKFLADLTVEGEIASDAPDLSSKKIKIHGDEYELPVRISELLDDGWELGSGEFKNEFKPKVSTSLISFYMYKDDVQISLREAYNDSDEVKKLEDCLLTGIDINIVRYQDTRELFSYCDFILPGGICENSTASDVVYVMGDPNTTEEFKGHCYNLEKQLTYEKQNVSGYSYSFTFDEDGKVSSVNVAKEMK